MAGSTLASRALGRLLAHHRKQAGYTVYAAAQLLETSQQTLGRVEDGVKSKVPQIWINALANAYNVGDDDRRVMIGLAQELAQAQKNWWRALADEMNPRFDHYVGLEDAARSLAVWRVAVLPGLLQSAEYRRAIAWAEYPDMPTDQVERRVEIAVRRQSRLDNPNFSVDVVLSEYVLREQVGGSAVMHDQLKHLATMAERPNVSLRVVPFDAPAQMGSIVGSFVLLEFPKLPQTGMVEPPVVFVEGYAGDLYLERETEVMRYRTAFAQISRVALNQEQTRQLVLSIAKEYGE
ncbi:helix-turn-helix domain-containing protein [Nocardia jejuensis]|uniref:helix-turn-helix domain-containing protein n=1 Tax=Nocardia jejuensis TaxID=328049 RepID=UPI00082E7F74|nr:helix-turn-helix transcriptional regulator [Nocardia jejuensis]